VTSEKEETQNGEEEGEEGEGQEEGGAQGQEVEEEQETTRGGPKAQGATGFPAT
jgi:hypothetical protein